jgi:hypothetical protein
MVVYLTHMTHLWSRVTLHTRVTMVTWLGSLVTDLVTGSRVTISPSPNHQITRVTGSPGSPDHPNTRVTIHPSTQVTLTQVTGHRVTKHQVTKHQVTRVTITQAPGSQGHRVTKHQGHHTPWSPGSPGSPCLKGCGFGSGAHHNATLKVIELQAPTLTHNGDRGLV